MKKKLLVFHPIIAPYRIDLFNELSKHFDTEIVLYWRNLPNQTFDYSKIEAQFEFTPEYLIKDEVGTAKWLKSIWRRLSKNSVDVVLVSEFGIITIIAILAKLICRKHYKLISIVDDSYNMVTENNQFTLRHKWATKLLMPFIDNVINVEPRVTEYYKQHYGKGLYFPIICDDAKAEARLSRVLPISEQYVMQYNLSGKKVLLFVGRLVDLKNIKFAINAYRRIANDNTAFVIVGDGPELANLRTAAADCDSVIFTGRLEGDELYAWYNVAQVFTLPSTLEPFGAVTNEALQGGCLALISKLAGSNCLVNNGENGYIIDPYDEKKFSDSIDNTFALSRPITTPLTLRESRMREKFTDLFSQLLCNL